MESSDQRWTFDGFSSPNFTTVPDEFFDAVAPRLNGGEVKLALYMIRRTYGFKKDSDNISLSQMLHGIVRKDGARLDLGAGLSKTTLLSCLKSLEEKNVICRVQQWDTRGACIATNYRLNVRERTPGLKTDLGGPGLKTDLAQDVNQTRGLVQKPTTQYTVNNKQKNNNVNVTAKAEKGRGYLNLLPDVLTEEAHINLVAEDILSALGDAQSKTFYRLVSRKVPEDYIRRVLAELKEGRVRSKPKVFTHHMMEYAREQLERELDDDRATALQESREKLLARLKYE